MSSTARSMLLLGFAPLVPNPERELFVLNLDEAALLSDRLGAALAAPTPLGHRIGDFDDLGDFEDDEYRYRKPYNSRYWL